MEAAHRAASSRLRSVVRVTDWEGRRLARLSSSPDRLSQLRGVFARLRSGTLPEELGGLVQGASELPLLILPEGVAPDQYMLDYANELGPALDSGLRSDEDWDLEIRGLVLDALLLGEFGVPSLLAAGWAVAVVRPNRSWFVLLVQALDYLEWRGVSFYDRLLRAGYFENTWLLQAFEDEVRELMSACAEADFDRADHALGVLERFLADVAPLRMRHAQSHGGHELTDCEACRRELRSYGFNPP